MENLNEKILVSVTGVEDNHYKDKIQEIREREIPTVALFLERFLPKQRENIYKELQNSPIKSIPLVHIRHDMNKEELEFLYNSFGSIYFTIHEDHFDILDKWSEFKNNLFLEMNTDNSVADNVKVEEIGGFCIDLAHYQKEKDRKTIDYDYIYERRNDPELFKCNHLSGYSFENMNDLHYVESRKDLEYLKVLPEFVFGDVIGIEIDNPIKEQLHFKEQIIKMLSAQSV